MTGLVFVFPEKWLWSENQLDVLIGHRRVFLIHTLHTHTHTLHTLKNQVWVTKELWHISRATFSIIKNVELKLHTFFTGGFLSEMRPTPAWILDVGHVSAKAQYLEKLKRGTLTNTPQLEHEPWSTPVGSRPCHSTELKTSDSALKCDPQVGLQWTWPTPFRPTVTF